MKFESFFFLIFFFTLYFSFCLDIAARICVSHVASTYLKVYAKMILKLWGIFRLSLEDSRNHRMHFIIFYCIYKIKFERTTNNENMTRITMCRCLYHTQNGQVMDGSSTAGSLGQESGQKSYEEISIYQYRGTMRDSQKPG